jgi:ABC-type multidrug transport system ATPase subunit
MKVSLENIGKRFNREQIFGGLNHVFEENEASVILGANGSGKSTLLQILGGSSTASEGSITYSHSGTAIPSENIFRHVSFASPYLELLEEFTLSEHIAFHHRLKPFREEIQPGDVPQLSGLHASRNKQIRHFSSGMKQRVRLALAILSDSALLLLDEPCSNLDKAAQTWYQELITTHASDRLILVCSNQVEAEYPFCKKSLRIEDYK